MADTKDNPPPAPPSALVTSSPGYARMDTGAGSDKGFRPRPRAVQRSRAKDRAGDRAMVRSFISLHMKRQEQARKGQQP